MDTVTASAGATRRVVGYSGAKEGRVVDVKSPLRSWTPQKANKKRICKNAKAHKSENVMFGHKIALAETDAFEALPVTGPLLVKCDGCREEYIYEPSEVLRLEMEAPEHSSHIHDLGN